VSRVELGAEGEVTKQTHADGTEGSVEYLPGAPYGERADFPTRFVDEANQPRDLTYDDFGRLASATDLSGGVWTYNDGAANVSTAMAPSGALVLTETWDDRGNLLDRGYGDGGKIRFTYGLGPDPIKISKASGAKATLAYDSMGRLLTQSVSTGGSETFAWNPDNQLQSHTDTTGSATYEYDARGALQALAHTDGTRVEYGRDLLGRVTELRVREPGTSTFHTTKYGYDAVSNLTSVEDLTGATTTFSYDIANRLVEQVRPNGIVTAVDYDLRNRVTKVVHRQADGTVLVSFDYLRGPRGEPLRITREDATAIEYDYDPGLRVTAERRLDADGAVTGETSWEYDIDGRRSALILNGRRLESHYLPGNRLSEVRDGEEVVESYDWDVDGRLVSITRNGETRTFAYDFEDQLISTVEGTEEMAFSYDATGRRIQVVEGGEVRRFVVAPGPDEAMDVVYGVQDPNEGWAGYVWAGSLPLARYQNGSVEHYLTDASGSVVSVVDSDGQEIESFDYDAFGAVRSDATPSDLVTLAGGGIRFQAQWLDAGSSLYHFRARVYDPVTGRFLTRDPLEPDSFVPETFDTYRFARSNPLVFSDPLGLFGVASVNVASLVNNIMSTMKNVALNMLKTRIKQELGSAISNIFLNWLGNVVGMTAPDWRWPKGVPSWRVGQLLEDVVQDVLCGVMKETPPLVYFEPMIDQADGRALTNGYTCEGRPGSRPSAKRGQRFPDLLLRQQSPMGPPRYGTLVVSEVKLSVSTFYNAYFSGLRNKKNRKGQWRAIWKHAVNYSYPPRAVLFISLRPGAKWINNRLRKEWRSKGLLGRVLTLL
jgi:RHS repeat-associated protein